MSLCVVDGFDDFSLSAEVFHQKIAFMNAAEL
jgi:hypothetical protein